MTEHVWVHGIFNVQKCVKYLRSVGVEISAETEAQWMDAQKSHRFLNSMKRPVRDGWDWWCHRGHHTYVETGRRGRKPYKASGCPTCGERLVVGQARWSELRDGTIRDYRPKAERWKALDWQPPPCGDDGPPDLPVVTEEPQK